MINKCLFPVAGFGTRFLPVTKSVPKEMLPIQTKPLIQHAIDEAMSTNIKSMLMVINEHKLAIKNYFEPHYYLESLIKDTNKEKLLSDVNDIIDSCSFSYIDQPKMAGLGNAIYLGKKEIGNSPFAVILPDDLCHNDSCTVLKQMLEIFKEHPDKCVIAVEEVPLYEVNKYGVISGDYIDGNDNVILVNDMIEKPEPSFAPSNLAIIGRYILLPEIFKEIENTKADHNGEIQITDALLKLAKKEKVLAYKFKGRRFDCGSIKGFNEANSFFASLDLNKP